MKRTILMMAAIGSFFLTSCGEEDTLHNSNDFVPSTAFEGGRICAAEEVLNRQMAEDPKFAQKIADLENFTDEVIRNGRLVNGVIEIPVVVNVLYRTNSQNVSQAQIQSQIDVLNEDFNATNADFNQVPTLFSGVKANVGIRFVLDQVVRKKTNKSSFRADDSMKKSSRGGINPTSPTTKLNLWVCNLSSGLLGYAQFPGGSSSTDGVVIDDNAFGRTGTASAPFNKGRTATHEVGHWMNLRHIWGDTTCGTDYVSDTPVHNTSNGGCPSYPHYSTCSGSPVEMTMNYMDYTNDACMYMFSNGQKSRMLAVFAQGGPRAAFAQ